jgi:hypothetical protein
MQIGNIKPSKDYRLWVSDTDTYPRLIPIADSQRLIRNRTEWIRRGRIQLLRNGAPWEGWMIDTEGTKTLHFKWMKTVYCVDDEKSYASGEAKSKTGLMHMKITVCSTDGFGSFQDWNASGRS